MLSASQPFSFILFGASGHLARIKLYPALYILALKKRIPEDYQIVGFSRSEYSDEEFRRFIEAAVREHVPAVNEDVLADFLQHAYYHQGQYDNPEDFASLAQRLQEQEQNWDTPVRLAYFSVPPEVFADVSKNLCAGGVHNADTGFRCLVEKPVGHNTESFHTIRDQLTGCFGEEEVYLLDHYLGKEAVRNIYYLRYANPVFERLLKNTLIDQVQITASEDDGLEQRAGYFDKTGTFRDMFQSHLLMIASLLTMRLQADDDIGAGRRDALEQFYLPPATSMDDLVLQGQYGAGTIGGESVPAYLDEDGVAKQSRTNTFACLKLRTRISRWDGIPFYLRSGKRLTKKETIISILFQEPRPVGEGATQNRLDIIMQGEAGMRLHLQTKLGGIEPAFRPLVMEDPLVCVGDCLPEHSLLILEAVHGHRQWFLSFREVETAWRLVDALQAHLDGKTTALHTYEAGTMGPAEADAWIAKDGHRWFS